MACFGLSLDLVSGLIMDQLSVQEWLVSGLKQDISKPDYRSIYRLIMDHHPKEWIIDGSIIGPSFGSISGLIMDPFGGPFIFKVVVVLQAK